MISYEYPLSERIRTLLRLEDLYQRLDYYISKNEALQNHVALLLIFEILEVASRADLKSDLLQELERQKQSLEELRGNPEISAPALDDILRQIDRSASRLYQSSGKIGQELRENEWLMGFSLFRRTAEPEAEPSAAPYVNLPWQCLYFLPEPHGHGSLRPIFWPGRVNGCGFSSTATSPSSWAWRSASDTPEPPSPKTGCS